MEPQQVVTITISTSLLTNISTGKSLDRKEVTTINTAMTQSEVDALILNIRPVSAP